MSHKDRDRMYEGQDEKDQDKEQEDTSGSHDEQDDSEEGEGGSTEQIRDKGRSAAEWTTLLISVLIVLSLAGLVIYQYIAGGTKPPVIEVETQIGEVRNEGDSFYLPISITNSGDVTAEEVEVEAILTSDGEEETSAVTIAFLAGGESESATAIFTSDPREGELKVRVVSYIEP